MTKQTLNLIIKVVVEVSELVIIIIKDKRKRRMMNDNYFSRLMTIIFLVFVPLSQYLFILLLFLHI
jgi:hypothetical protein